MTVRPRNSDKRKPSPTCEKALAFSIRFPLIGAYNAGVGGFEPVTAHENLRRSMSPALRHCGPIFTSDLPCVICRFDKWILQTPSGGIPGRSRKVRCKRLLSRPPGLKRVSV